MTHDVTRSVWGRWTLLLRRLEREFRDAERRMATCRHERVTFVDIGSGHVTTKCIDCWALYIDGPFTNGVNVHGGRGPYWTPNSSPPPERP